LRVSAGAINRQMTGTLPVEITVALAAIATYEVTVEQSDENPFRGAYIKSVDSRMGLITEVVPRDFVEL
jgi:hypothetical protein